MNESNTPPDAKPEEESKLLELARKKFPDLTPAEEKLFRCVEAGEVADYSSKNKEENDPGKAETWTEERVIGAKCIVWLCTDTSATALVTHQGIQVIGARIGGVLDLSFIKISFPLGFMNSNFPEIINLVHSQIQTLNLGGTLTGPIMADEIKVYDSLYLREGFHSRGEVRLLGATIGGCFDCGNAKLSNPGKKAISADGININGSLHMQSGFIAEGEVSLLGAVIGGDFVCEEGQFRNPEQTAISADGIKIGRGLFLRKSFKADGEVRLVGAVIGGDFDCENAQFSNKDKDALFADQILVKQSLYLRKGFKAEGKVRLLGAYLGGNLDCENGQFLNHEGDALSTDGIRIKGNVYIRFKKAEISGRVSFVQAIIEQSFQWRDISNALKFKLDLRGARIGMLWDDKDNWPQADNLWLHGLVYGEIFDEAPHDAKSRLDWLRRQPKDQWSPQPYEQLAKVLRESGHEEDAKKILIGKNWDRVWRKPKKNVWQIIGNLLYRITVGYGYRPMWALGWMLGFIVFGMFLFGNYPCQKIMKTLSDTAPPFNALIYSIDTFLPLVDLQQASFWHPITAWLRTYLWFHIMAGWALTSLFVGGLTRLIRS